MTFRDLSALYFLRAYTCVDACQSSANVNASSKRSHSLSLSSHSLFPTTASPPAAADNPAPLLLLLFVDSPVRLAACENFSCYEKGLVIALDLIAAALEHSGAEEEGVNNQDPILSDPHFQEIKKLSAMDRRITKVHRHLKRCKIDVCLSYNI